MISCVQLHLPKQNTRFHLQLQRYIVDNYTLQNVEFVHLQGKFGNFD